MCLPTQAIDRVLREHSKKRWRFALSCASRAVRPTEVGENAYTQYQALREPNPCDLPNERPSAARQEREAFLQSQGAKASVSSLLSNQNNQPRTPAAKWVSLCASNRMWVPTQARSNDRSSCGSLHSKRGAPLSNKRAGVSGNANALTPMALLLRKELLSAPEELFALLCFACSDNTKSSASVSSQ